MTDNPSPDHVPTPITDWPAWSAEMHARLHPEHGERTVTVGGLTYTFKDTTPDAPMNAKSQIDLLADFIMAEIPGEPSQSEGAGDCAIRLLRQYRAERDALRSRMALTEDERKAVESVTQWVDMGEHLHDYQVRHLLAIISRLTRDADGR